MLQTLIGVIVGGTLAILSQVVVEALRGRAERRRERQAAWATTRVHQLHLYSAQQLLKESLETGAWWPIELTSFAMPTDQDLRILTALLPLDVWRSYTAAVRRLTGCAKLRDAASDRAAPVDPVTLQRLLGTYVTVDHARRMLSEVTGVEPSEQPLLVSRPARQL